MTATLTPSQRDRPSEAWIAALRARYRVERTVDECLTRKLRSRGQPYRIHAAVELEAPLAAYVRAQMPDAREVAVRDLRRAPGGASKENFAFDVEWLTNGERRREELLLRMDPGEAIVETHRLREFQLLRAAAGAVPVPRALWVDPEGVALGRPFLVMERVAGRTQAQVGGRVSGVGIAFEKELRGKIADQFLRALVGLHTVDWRRCELSAFDVPREGTTEAVEWLLDWWARVWEEDRLEDHPLVFLAERWLRRNMPPVSTPRLVHGDFRSGNFLYDDDGRIRAFLDWELGHIGDPHEDLAWVLNRLFMVADPEEGLLACGLFRRDELLRRYQEESGIAVDPEKLHFYEVFNNYKLTIICQTTNLRAARDERTHLPAMMNFIHTFGYVFMAELARQLGVDGSAT